MDKTIEYTDRQFQDILDEVIVKLQKDKHPVENPMAFLLGGQAGAGKSTLHGVIKEKLQRNIITIDNDTFKPLHPNYEEIAEIYGKETTILVSLFSGKMTEALIEYFSKEKYNLIIEGTLRTTEIPIKTATMLKKRGYDVNLYVMAVAQTLSYLGTLERYEDMFSKEPLTARETKKEIHDVMVLNLPSNLDALFKQGIFNEICLYTREKEQLYSSLNTPSESPKKTLENKLNEKISGTSLLKICERILDKMGKNNHQSVNHIIDLLEKEIPQKEIKNEKGKGLSI